MIDDFKQVPERQPARLDSDRSYVPKTERPNTDRAPYDASPRTTDTQPVARPLPEFRTPEQVAAMESAATAPSFGSATPNNPAVSPSVTPGDLASDMENTTSVNPEAPAAAPNAPLAAHPPATITLFRRWTVPRKKFIIAAAASALVLIGGGTALAMALNKPEPPKPVARTKAVSPPAPKPIVSPLTGIEVTAAQRDLPVTGVMIENSPQARPQSGLKDAGVVYEAIAEAGITRFLALYQEAQPGDVGPIRSSRPYYLDWAMAFDASYAHVGGSPDALQRIKDIQVKDLDQFYNPTAYHRITSRYAPHNVYTGVDQLTALAKTKGYDKSTFTSFIRKADLPYKAPAPAPTATKSSATKSAATQTKPAAAKDTRAPATAINLGISGAFYNVRYDYDAGTNTYKRALGGSAHMDAATNTQITPKVVIALAMPYGLMADGFHSQYTTIGSGKMFVFQDGTVTTGVWSKGEPKEQFVFKDDAGKVLALNPGQTWISVVGDAAKVTYQ